MDRVEKTNEKVEELFHQPAAGEGGSDGEFMQILQRYIFGELCFTGSLDNRMRELVTITVLTTIPVSYTHLDVYKRQVLTLMRRTPSPATHTLRKLCENL